MANPEKIYPRSNDPSTCYLKNIVKNPNIVIDDYTFYNDSGHPEDFEKKNVLYHYPVNHDKLIIDKFCSIACGAKFIFNSANHTLSSFSTYPFPIFPEEWDKTVNMTEAWDNKGDIVLAMTFGSDMKALLCQGSILEMVGMKFKL